MSGKIICRIDKYYPFTKTKAFVETKTFLCFRFVYIFVHMPNLLASFTDFVFVPLLFVLKTENHCISNAAI